MSLVAVLMTTLGKPVADRLVQILTAKKGGAQKLEQATAALGQGLSAIEALKKTFGKDFPLALNEVLGTSSRSTFSYQAGTLAYIRLDASSSAPTRVLKDELNLNLDRLTVLDVRSTALKNQAWGIMTVWWERCQDILNVSHDADAHTAFKAIQDLLSGETQGYRQIFNMLRSTGLGITGALTVIGGAILATGTGAGFFSWVMLALFGVPWLTVAALAFSGALLIAFAAKKPSTADEISMSIMLAYKMLERIDRARMPKP